jgi:hypothetical protein
VLSQTAVRSDYGQLYRFRTGHSNGTNTNLLCPWLDQITVFVKRRRYGAPGNGELMSRLFGRARANQRYQFDQVASGDRRGCARDSGITCSHFRPPTKASGPSRNMRSRVFS